MLIQSFLLLWTVLQVFIPGSQTMPQDASFCATFTEQECQEPDAMRHCPMTCSACAPPWFKLGSRCFYVNNELPQLSWSAARLECNKKAGTVPATVGIPLPQLAVGDLALPDLSNQVLLVDYIKNNGLDTSAAYWLGGSDLLEKGTWQWIDNSLIRVSDNPSTLYTPKPDVARECLFMRPDRIINSVPTSLNNGGCEATLYFICERI